MPEYLSPGVYIEEVPSGNQPIEGVSTSTAGMVGMAERGPINTPILVTSFGEYQQWFGGYLPITEFSNGPVAHCYLPHAVEGFFTNGGNLAYIVRVLDSTAAYASAFLFDRGLSTSASTLILRRAGALTGTIPNPPGLCVQDSTDLTTPGTWFRVGDGSNAEYVQVNTTTLDETLISLVMPLSRSHASGATIQDCTWTLSPATTFAINANGNPTVGPDVVSLHLTGASSDVTNALALALPAVIQIGFNASPEFRREYRYVTNIIKISSTDVEVVLDSPISLQYLDQTPIAWIALNAPISTQSLGIDASAGDSLIFANSSLIGFSNTTDLIVIDSGSTSPEIRRIGRLHQLGLALPAYALYPAGSVVEEAGDPTDFKLAIDAPSGSSSIFVLGDEEPAPNTTLTMADGTHADPVEVTSSAAAELLTIAPALLHNYTPAAALTLALALTKAVTLGDQTITVTSAQAVIPGMSITFSSGGPVATYTVSAVDLLTGVITFSIPIASGYLKTATVTGALTLAANASTGATSIVLAGYYGFLPGMSLTLNNGGDPAESPTVDASTPAAQFNLAAPTPDAFAAANTVLVSGASITKLTTAAIASGNVSVTLNSVDGLAAGMSITIDETGANPEKVFIQSIAGSAVTFAPAALHSHNPGVIVLVPPFTLTAAVVAGAASNVLALNSRLGLNVGDLLRIGSSPNYEYATISTLPQRGPAPDAGTVILGASLQQSYAIGASVVRMGTLAVDLAGPVAPAAVPIDTPVGATGLLITDGSGSPPNAFGAGDVIKITIPTGEEYFHIINANSAVAPADIDIDMPALERSHAAGQPVVGRDPIINVRALDAGAWGDRVQVIVQDEASGLVSKTTLATIIDSTHIKLQSPSGVQVGTILELFDPSSGLTIGPDLKVDAFSQTDFTITLQTPLTVQQTSAQAATPGGLGVRSREFQIQVNLLRRPDPAVPSRNTQVIDSESYRWLSMDPRHSNYLQTIIGDIDGPISLTDNRPIGASNYIRVHDLAQDILDPVLQQGQLWSVRLGPEGLVDTLPDGRQRPAVRYLENGSDAVDMVFDATYLGADSPDPVERTGFYALTNIDGISIIACPGQTSAVVQQGLIDQSEHLLFRMAVLDGPVPPNDTLADVQAQRQNYDSKYAALYHPWLLIPDPFPTNLNNISPFPIPPSGHTMGVYARVDVTRGVHKAPANELINGITGLQRTLNKSEQDILNPYPVNINVNRDFRSTDRGIRIYGGRIITSDSDWLYVNVRRLAMFIEASLYQGLQWVVFEPNAEPLWARVRRTISDFLKVVWKNGALEGSKPEEAFYVKCDATTMTQTEIDNGELIALVGIAPVRPAEFVIVRIGLWTYTAS